MDLELITSILLIIGIDIVLGGDNAIVIALASRNLPEYQRNKAIFLGTGLAVIVRIVLTILAVYLLTIPYLQLIGGFLLVIIAFKLLVSEGDDASSIRAGVTLGAAVRTIVFADIVMGLDNVIAVAGAAHGNIILVVTGLLVSVPIIVWGSKLILYLMERFPLLVYGGAAILAYTAGNMIGHEKNLHSFFADHTSLGTFIPFLTIAVVLISGMVVNSFRSTK
ncbi:TerC family protein [Priestia megaterium]|uniref:TerC family protein n=1 Tax=Priestia megaterium TaxID=1404 RepID=UPI001C220DC3|nr:TerC family protein [Priestia megaterium]MBU8686850.1 TerC family protein [Priestia megaterium]MDI3092797.1 TerC family protein [Priestia megaterium]